MVSGVDTCISAPIDIAVFLTISVEDLRVKIWNVLPDAGNINLGLCELTVPRRVVADIRASPMVLIVSAVLPSVDGLGFTLLASLACLSL